MSKTARFAGRVALISGGAGGIGSELTRALAAEGACVVIGDTDAERGHSLAKEIGDAARFARLDVREEQSWLRAFAMADEAFAEPVTVLAHCAGVILVRPIEQTSAADIDHQIAVNLLGPVLGTRLAIDPMKTRGGGSVLVLSSRAGVRGTAYMSAYAASQAASANFAQSAAVELGRYGIRVNALAPGGIDTPMSRGLMRNHEDQDAAERFRTLPVPRIGVPTDVVPTALLLLSENSAYITGAVIPVDGGASAR
jgi:3alpha(or 20beta)-hydroxysteroid dehydrogenase